MGIFAATTAALILVFWVGTRVGGGYVYNMGPLTINIFAISPFLFVLGLAGMWSHGSGKWKNASSLILLYAIPAVLYVSAPAKAPLVFYTVCFVSMALAAGVRRKQLIRFAGVWAIGVATYVTFGLPVYELSRLQAFLHPFAYAEGAGYQAATAIKTVMNAGLWGHGFGSPLRMLPGTSDDLVLTYMIHAFGWGAGLLFLLLVFLYAHRLLGIAAQSKDPFGRLLTRGYSTLLLAQFIWSCAMAVGLAPISASILPFVSHGGTLFIAQTLALGLILSVYRRVDLLPASSVRR